MRYVRWSPFSELEDVFETLPTIANGLELAADLYEDNGNLIAEMHIPGIEPDRIDIEVHDKILHVSGSRQEKEETKDKHYYRKEIRRGSFERTIMLPVAVEGDKATAHFEHGVLKIALPIEKTKEHKVKVKVN